MRVCRTYRPSLSCSRLVELEVGYHFPSKVMLTVVYPFLSVLAWQHILYYLWIQGYKN